MKPGCFFPALALIAAFCMALASIASATHMAPVGANAPAYQAYVATGGFDDLCEVEGQAHSHEDCPFCRLLADPDDLTPLSVTWQLEAETEALQRSDLVSLDQLYQHSVTARGPPAAA